ncbi:MMPL family transporter [Streptomyces sp. PRB2-1]|uniref:MMPL family transporter n=1 Tax=Actinacidiphila epipremni TaxID=2053013 RepID=A0ABX0ZWI7_9ACTN|nr:MMPL family transporter [Actinacidiphila epipremni]
MERMTRWVLAHRWQVVLVWVVLALAGGATASGTVDKLSYESKLPGRHSQQANDDLNRQFATTGGKNAPLLLTVTLPAGTGFDTPDVRNQWTALVDGVTPKNGRNVTYASGGAGSTDAALVSKDGRTTVALVYPPANPTTAPYDAWLPGIKKELAHATLAGAPVELTGQPVVSGRDSGGARSPVGETLVGALGALIVLALVFASGLAVLPLLMAAVAIPTTFLLVRGVVSATDVSFIVQYLVALIGLGVAIDYALLVVTRWREERGRPGAGGPEPEVRKEAIVRALASAGRAVALSGATVAISLAALVVIPVPFLRSVGYGGLLIPIVSVAVATTLLPVMLYSLGDKLDRPRRTHNPDSRLWSSVARFTVRRPAIAAVVSGAVLLAIAAPVLTIRLGAPETRTLAHGGQPAASFQKIVDAGFGEGIARPVEVLAPKGDAASLTGSLARLDGVSGAVSPAGWARGDRTVVDVWTTADPSSPAGRDAVSDVVDTAQRTPQVLAGGTAPAEIDFIDAVYGNLWLIFVFVALLTFLVLARTLRSIVLPIKALVLNALSTCAAYGAVVLIWQKGYGSDALYNTPAVGAITIWVPMTVFAFLFGLSMDYEVFILHRIRETHADLAARGEQDTTVPAVVTGISRTGRLVTSAAFILFLAFVSLSTVPITDVRVFATALAAGIIVDATVVRGVLAPALVTLMGRANWWFPDWAAKALLVRGRPRPAAAGAPVSGATPDPAGPAERRRDPV